MTNPFRIVLLLLVAKFVAAQVTMSNGPIIPLISLPLPSASLNTGRSFYVSSTGNCTTAGATVTLCYSNGSAWSAVSSGGGGGGTVTTAVISGTSLQIAATGTCTIVTIGTCTLSIINNPTLPGTTTGVFSGPLTGNVTGNVSGTAGTITGSLALANTPLTTEGDILVVRSGPSLGRLAKGTQYQTLQGGATDTLFDAVHLDQSTAITGILPNANTTATNANTASTIVARDSSGNFSAGTITATLTGNASTATALAVTPTLCSTGQAPTGILASGNATGCASISSISGLTTNVLPKASSPTAIANSSFTDTGSAASTTEPFSAPSVSTGASPPAIAWFTGTAGIDGFGNGTCTGTVPSSTGFLCDNAGQPLWMQSGGNTNLVQGPLSSTNNNGACMSGITGGIIADCGFAPIGAATTKTLTNTTFDTAGTGNSFKVAGTGITALSGTGGVLCTSVGSACSGGGGMSYLYSSGPVAGISTPASPCGSEPCATDTLIWDSGALPALAAGACAKVDIWINSTIATSGNNWVLWIGSTAQAGADIYTYTSTDTGPYHTQAVYCNLAGSQTTQTAYAFTTDNSGGSFFGRLPSSVANLTQTLSSAYHVSLSNATNNGSGVTTSTVPISATIALGQ